MRMLDSNFFSGIKTKQDFDREREEFEFRKRQRQMDEQMGNLQMQQAQASLNAPKMPYEGTGLETQLMNQKYMANLQSGMSEQEALQNATDTVLQSNVQIDPQTGYQIRRGSIFGNSPSQVNSMPPRQVINSPMNNGEEFPSLNAPSAPVDYGYIDDPIAAPPIPLPGNDPLIANQQAAAARAAELGQLDPSNAQPAPVSLEGFSPRAQEELRKKEAEAAIQDSIKQAQEQRKTGKSQKVISTTLNELEDLNNRLLVKKAIVSNDQNMLQNLRASMGSSAFGQSVAQTQNIDVQTLRNQYNLARNSLIPFYVDYFQLPATMVDTEEMSKRIIEAFGDPSLDYTTNKTAIGRMRSQFGIPASEQGNGSPVEKYKTKYGLE